MPGAQRDEPGAVGVVVARARPRRRGRARWATFWWAWKIVSFVARMGGRRETDGHALGEERAVVRARQEVAPAATDDAVARPARSRGRPSASRRAATRTRPRRSGSPSPLRARSAARRAIRVTHSSWRMSSPRSRRSRRSPARSYRSRISVVPSVERCPSRSTKSTPGVQVEGELRVDDVGLVTREECHDEHHRPWAELRATASTTRSAARPSTTPTTCSTARRRSAASSSGRSSARSIPATTSSKHSGAVERAGGGQLLVVLADDVLRRPGLARRRPLVVEHADGRTVADERVEEDRARVADDDVHVLEERREVVEVRVARLLHRHARPARAQRRSAPATGRHAGAAERGAEGAHAGACSHHPTSRSTNRPSYGALLGVFPATSTSGRAGVEPVPRAGAPRTRRAAASGGGDRSAAIR